MCDHEKNLLAKNEYIGSRTTGEIKQILQQLATELIYLFFGKLSYENELFPLWTK